MTTLFVMAFALIWVIAFTGRKPRHCTQCGQPLPGYQLISHYQKTHATDRTP